MISKADLGWLAAIIDMRGRVYYRNRTNGTQQVTLTVDLKNYAVIRKLCALVGTKIETHPARPAKEWMQRPCAEHCPDRHQHYHKESVPEYTGAIPSTARWSISGAALVVILFNVIPYLLEWDTWTTLMHEILAATTLEGQGSGATRASLQRLHDLGWALPPQFLEAVVTMESEESSVV